jgi:anhydro-N-acetylmuramic acid kinase
MAKLYTALGLMSGTSLDGIDVALIETDGSAVVKPGPAATFSYPKPFRVQLRQAIADAQLMTERTARPGCLAEVERELTDRHAEAVRDFLRTQGVDPSRIDIVGFHGQTVLHRSRGRLIMGWRPASTLTVQLGDGPRLAAAIGLDVVCDLRAADCAAGGEGAPLAPIYHWALTARLPERPAAFLNVGGVANLTYIGADGRLVAFDTGPGNALIDDWVYRSTGAGHDEDGALALSGRVRDGILQELMRHDYFFAPYPKSLDRNDFALDPLPELSPADGAATLTAFTAASVRAATTLLPESPRYWVVCGGGRHNRALMTALAERLDGAVVPAEALGLDGDHLEAQAWAYLAVRSLQRLPISYPGTTGVPIPMTGGVLFKRA